MSSDSGKSSANHLAAFPAEGRLTAEHSNKTSHSATGSKFLPAPGMDPI